MFCILGQIGVFVLIVGAAASNVPLLSTLGLLLILGLLIYMIISVIRLVKALDESVVLYAILTLVCGLSLIVLIILSQRATKRLTQAGIKVGLLGADPNSI